MSERISVIVPIYNVERYLEKCIDSILAQTYRKLEIILCDDGSTDGCGAICDRYAARDDRVRVIHKANGGLSDARNAGLEIASGGWYAFIDSDDFITPDTIERMYRTAVSTNSQIAVCNIIRIYDDGAAEPFYRPAQEQTLLSGASRFETLKQPSACNKLFRADLFKGDVAGYIADAAKKLGGKITFVNAIHYTKGEGIEKKVDDFAAEVAAQVAGAAK